MSEQKVKILLIGDCPALKEDIHKIIPAENNKTKFITSIAACSNDALKKLGQDKFDLIILDFHVKGFWASEVVKTIFQLPEIKILAIVNSEKYVNINTITLSGINGYLLKNNIVEDIPKAIETVLNKRIYCSQDIHARLLNDYVYEKKGEGAKVENNAPENYRAKYKKSHFTERETDILRLLINNQTSMEIAEELKISKRTVDNCRHRMLNKFNLKSTRLLIKHVLEYKLI